MIAVAVRDSNAKITTPNEAATSHGVSPISSGRNVMVKVKDTLSFIEAARAVHGDRYDYSQTEWNGANSEIWIVCEVHGRYRLAQAGTHYRSNKKPCGCRRCGDDSRMTVNKCKCGKKVSGSKDWNYRKHCCSNCGKHVHKTSNCRHCGKSFPKVNGKSFCSMECRKAKNANNPWSKTLRTFTCVSCGKECTREVRNNVRFMMCNRACHMAWVGRPDQHREKDWLAASKKAKTRWMRKNRFERKAKSIICNWFRLARTKAKELSDGGVKSKCETKCATASTTLCYRLNLVKNGHKKIAGKSWESLCKEGVSSGGYSTMDQWEKKCYSTYKNMKWKRRLRNVKKHTSIPIADAEQQPKQLSIWEFLETQQRAN